MFIELVEVEFTIIVIEFVCAEGWLVEVESTKLLRQGNVLLSLVTYLEEILLNDKN